MCACGLFTIHFLSLTHSLTNSYQKQISSTHSFIYWAYKTMERMEISKTHLSRIPDDDDDEVGRWLLSTYFADMYFFDGSNIF